MPCNKTTATETMREASPHMMRVGLFKDVHVKTLTSQKRRALLTARSLLQEKAIDLENEVRELLRNFGLKVGHASGGMFERRILELVEHDAELAEIMEPLLPGRRKLPNWKRNSSPQLSRTRFAGG
jgi:transposase